MKSSDPDGREPDLATVRQFVFLGLIKVHVSRLFVWPVMVISDKSVSNEESKLYAVNFAARSTTISELMLACFARNVATSKPSG